MEKKLYLCIVKQKTRSLTIKTNTIMNLFQRLFKKREEEIFRPATQEEINHKTLFKNVILFIISFQLKL